MAGQRVIEAIDCLVRDVDNQYEEHLLDKVLECTQTHLMPWETSVLCRLKSYFDSYIDVNSGSPINLARALKVFGSILSLKNVADEVEFSQLTSCLRGVWGSVDRIMVDKNLQALSMTLSMFDKLANTRRGYLWLAQLEIDLPIILYEGVDYKINNLVSLVQFCVRTAERDSMRDSAGLLMSSLVLNSVVFLPPNHQQIICLKELIRGLPEDEVSMHALIDLITSIVDLEISKEALLSLYEIPQILARHFEDRVSAQPFADIDHLCSCLALVNGPSDFNRYLERLIAHKKLDGIIIYLSESNYKGHELSQLIQGYLIYPLLKDCITHAETVVLSKRLLATPEQLEFVDTNWTSRIVELACCRLNWICEDNYYLNEHTTILMALTLFNFTKRQKGRKERKESLRLCRLALKTLTPSIVHLREATMNNQVLEELHRLVQLDANTTQEQNAQVGLQTLSLPSLLQLARNRVGARQQP